MIDHIYLPVTNIKRSLDFYSALLTPLGTADRWKFEAKAGYPTVPRQRLLGFCPL
jgi:catechol 2,3-dioxygenase-like lactoylglutathione lyase family enzyme